MTKSIPVGLLGTPPNMPKPEIRNDNLNMAMASRSMCMKLKKIDFWSYNQQT